jgi:hypothetical protein
MSSKKAYPEHRRREIRIIIGSTRLLIEIPDKEIEILLPLHLTEILSHKPKIAKYILHL